MNPITARRPSLNEITANAMTPQGQRPSLDQITSSVLTPKPPVNPILGGAREFLGGLTFETSDELEAMFRSGQISGDEYRRLRDQIRGEREQFQKENKGTSMALNVAGGVAPTMAALALSGGTASPVVIPSLGARVARGVAAGMVTGAATGAGMAPERADVPKSAALTGGFGAVLGGTIPAAISGIGAGAGKLLDVAESPIRALAETVQRPASAPVPDLTRQIGPTRTAAAMLRNPAGELAQRVGVPILERRARSRAEAKLVQAMIDDGMTPEQAATRLQEMQSRGSPAAVADVGQENMLELTNTPYIIPGRGRQVLGRFFSDRAAGTSGRLAEGLEKTSTAKMGNVRAMVRQIDAERKAPAKALYERAYAHGEVQLDEDALNLLLTKDLRSAWFKGLRRSQLDAMTDADKVPLPKLFEVGVDEAGDEVIQLARNPTVRDIDVVKRGIDAMITKADNAEDRDMVRILRGVKDKLLSQTDEQAPDYKAARRFWGGQQGLMSALEQGKRFMRLGADDFEDAIAGLTEDEIGMYRIGAANAIAEQLRNKEGRQIALNVLTDPKAQQRLRSLYPDEESFQTLMNIVSDELQMAGPYRRLSGQSQTAQNLLNVLDFATDFRPGDIVPDPMSLGKRALMGLVNAGQQRAQQSSAAQLADLLTKQGPGAVAYLQSLQSRAAAQAAQAAAASKVGGRVGGVLGGQLNRRSY